MRLHSVKDGVKIVRIYFYELALLEFGEQARTLPGKIPEHADNKRQLLWSNGTADLDVVSDLDSRGPNLVQFILCTLPRHAVLHRFAEIGSAWNNYMRSLKVPSRVPFDDGFSTRFVTAF
jgi:hypothetical protein